MDVGKRRSSMQAILSYCAVISFKARACARQTLKLCPGGDDTHVRAVNPQRLQILRADGEGTIDDVIMHVT